MEDVVKVVGALVLILGLAVGIALLCAYPTLWLVNYLFTPGTLISLFGIAQLTFWKAFWLNFLCSILFKSSNISTSSKK